MQLNDAQKARLAQEAELKGSSTPPPTTRSKQPRKPVAQASIAPIGSGVGAMIAGLEQAEDNAAEALATRLEQSPERIMGLAMDKLAARGWNPEATFRDWSMEFDKIPTAVTGRDSYAALAPAIDVTP